MFGAAPIGSPLVELLTSAGLAPLIPATIGQTEPLPAELPDGRVVAVTQAPVAGGGRVATYDDVTERRATEARLAYMARHDLLTGLPNRLAFSEHVKAAFGRAASDPLPAMLCINIDQFRIVNNTLGPTVGDALLAAVAERLRANLRSDDDAAFRLGGDEFAVFQQGGNHKDDITTLAERLIARFATPFLIGQHTLQLSVSIGIARAQDIDAQKPEVLIRCAGLALRQAKTQGRGFYRVYTSEMDAHLQERQALELDLRAALAQDEMLVLYQPQVSVGRGISGFEALLRWHHPTRGIISPTIFIPLAEETGLIGALGDWVLRRACADAAAWPEGVKVAVNLSPSQFEGRDVAGNVAAALAESGLSPDRLEMEITEAVMLQSDSQVLRTLNDLRAAGVRVALDDFGTGYSSLSYLSRFTFDKIKIDQSFVRGMLERRDCLAIIRSVIGLGRALDMSVIAEGVETQAQCDRLVQEGCTDIQGYLFGRPQPLSSVAALFRRHGTVRPAVDAGHDRAVAMARLQG
jgi:diguanylate cyclase (GGDEF)-like protein